MNIKEEGKNTTTLKGLKINPSLCKSLLYKTPINLTFENDCYIFVGRNGTGKTRILQALNGKLIYGIDPYYPPLTLSPEKVFYHEKTEEELNLSYEFTRCGLREEDKNIHTYVNTANNYLWGKYLSYEPSKRPNYIFLKNKEGKNISHHDLTRGEYRVLSILYDAYLPRVSTPMLFLIDTPECNLCVPSKMRIIDDILESGNVGLLIVATHSATVINDRWHNVVNLDDYV